MLQVMERLSSRVDNGSFFYRAILLQRKASRAPDRYDCTGQERGKLEYSVVGLLRKV